MYNILVLGSGGREHALSWKIAQSSLIDRLYIAPGNPGTASLGTNVNLQVNDFEGIKKFVIEHQIRFLVVGPEDPLVNGIHDFIKSQEETKNVVVIGPEKAGALLEGSKDFSKQFMKRHKIPTAAYSSFTKDTVAEGEKFLESLKPPYVLKADGLAAGKGVLILSDLAEAKSELRNMLTEGKFGEAGNKVVIEEFLDGIEVSYFVLTDGSSYKILPSAKDYKRIGEGDTGLNTGGMGAVSPVPFIDSLFHEKVETHIIARTIQGLQKDGIPYQGFIFFGLINVGGDPYVIEYNVRMGDPETEVVMPRLNADIVDLFEGIATGTLSEVHIEEDPRTVCTVMLVSGGYPEDYEKGKEIVGMKNSDKTIIFHAGTKEENGKIVTSGGRVLAVSSYGRNISEALENSYRTIGNICYDGIYYRKDIGQDLIREKSR
jgi:phosphoribosylamine---glycine ligase